MALTKVTGDMTSGIADESGLASVQTFTSSGTWTRPTGITKVIVEVQGAGGAGGSSGAAYNGAGAGGGGYAKKFLDVSSISTSTITVGSGGTGSTSSNGSSGGDSSWADGTNTITGSGGAGGGQGSSGSWGTGGSGGSATNGDLNISGKNGVPTDATGGSSFLGFGGDSTTGANNSQKAGQLYGGGGQGGLNTADSTSRAGASGANGIVIVLEYK